MIKWQWPGSTVANINKDKMWNDKQRYKKNPYLLEMPLFIHTNPEWHREYDLLLTHFTVVCGATVIMCSCDWSELF